MIRKILTGALILSLIANAWLLHTRSNAIVRSVKCTSAAETAGMRQAEVNAAPARQSATIARKSDDEAAALYEAGRRAGDTYARAHAARLRDNACPASHADLPDAYRAAEGDHRFAGWVPDDMVAVSRADFDACTAAGTRLIEVHQAWERLKAAGLAVASDPEDQ